MTIRTKGEAAQPVLPRRLDRIQGKGGRDANELWLVCPDGQLHHEFVIGREKARLVEIKGDREEVDEPLWRKQLHRDSERQLHFDSKFEHEEMVLVA